MLNINKYNLYSLIKRLFWRSQRLQTYIIIIFFSFLFNFGELVEPDFFPENPKSRRTPRASENFFFRISRIFFQCLI